MLSIQKVQNQKFHWLFLFFQLKQFLKTCSVSNYTKKIRQLLDKIEENSRFIERERAKMSFNLNDEKMITAWETNVRTKGTPLLTYYQNWSKINNVQKVKKVSKNDEIVGELAKIKRPKISDKPQNVKPTDKKPLELFPSDDEDDNSYFKAEEADKNETSASKAKKPRKEKKKSNKKKNIVNDDSAIDDKGDVVQELSVNDW